MNAKPLYLLIAFVCALPLSNAAQSDTLRGKQHTIYMGLLGNGFVYCSLAYDLSWPVGKSHMSAGAGVGYMPGRLDSYGGTRPMKFTLPIQWNWFYGKRSSRIEHGLGLTFGSGLDWSEASIPDYGSYVISEAIWACIKPIAYRYQRDQGGFFFRAQGYLIVKVAELNAEWRQEDPGHRTVGPLVGLDFGYTFRSKQRKAE